MHHVTVAYVGPLSLTKQLKIAKIYEEILWGLSAEIKENNAGQDT